MSTLSYVKDGNLSVQDEYPDYEAPVIDDGRYQGRDWTRWTDVVPYPC